MSNRLDPDQARGFVGHGLGPICYQQMTLVGNELSKYFELPVIELLSHHWFVLIFSEKGYNEVCTRDVECMGPDLVCRSSMCQCTPDKMYDGMMCVASKDSLFLVSTTSVSLFPY